MFLVVYYEKVMTNFNLFVNKRHYHRTFTPYLRFVRKIRDAKGGLIEGYMFLANNWDGLLHLGMSCIPDYPSFI